MSTCVACVVLSLFPCPISFLIAVVFLMYVRICVCSLVSSPIYIALLVLIFVVFTFASLILFIFSTVKVRFYWRRFHLPTGLFADTLSFL